LRINREILSKPADKSVNAVARYPRTFTVTPFTLLIGFNRILACVTRRAGVVAATDQGRRNFRNFSRNRPDTTNLNHQYAMRRAFIASILAA
jgi:hypothetical protein